jgi:hypothetical protein
MKHITAITLTTLLAATGLAQTAAAAAPAPVALDLTVGYDSEYCYRGLWFSNENTWFNLGASKKLSDTTTVSALAYYTADSGSTYQELDLGASVAYDAGFATLTAGYTYFFFFDGYCRDRPRPVLLPRSLRERRQDPRPGQRHRHRRV